jgi:uncharacterized protein YjdB
MLARRTRRTPTAILGLLTVLGLATGATTLVQPVTAQGRHGGTLREPPEVPPSRTAFVEYMCHLEDIGDTEFFEQPLACGSDRESKRVEGFAIRLGQGSAPVDLRYMAHLEEIGDTGWKHLGEFIGTRGKGLRLEGFAIEVTGDAADRYDVYYTAHLRDDGNTGWHKNGQFCGTRGQFQRVESIAVYLAEKGPEKGAETGAPPRPQ